MPAFNAAGPSLTAVVRGRAGKVALAAVLALRLVLRADSPASSREILKVDSKIRERPASFPADRVPSIQHVPALLVPAR